MIVRDAPSLPQLLFAIRGSIIVQTAPKILFFTLYAAAILWIDRSLLPLPQVSIAAMGIFGIALSLFLGFRNNAAYDRWWEARKLWGQLIADARHLKPVDHLAIGRTVGVSVHRRQIVGLLYSGAGVNRDGIKQLLTRGLDRFCRAGISRPTTRSVSHLNSLPHLFRTT